jgi:hypothetical protein
VFESMAATYPTQTPMQGPIPHLWKPHPHLVSDSDRL